MQSWVHNLCPVWIQIYRVVVIVAEALDFWIISSVILTTFALVPDHWSVFYWLAEWVIVALHGGQRGREERPFVLIYWPCSAVLPGGEKKKTHQLPLHPSIGCKMVSNTRFTSSYVCARWRAKTSPHDPPIKSSHWRVCLREQWSQPVEWR